MKNSFRCFYEIQSFAIIFRINYYFLEILHFFTFELFIFKIFSQIDIKLNLSKIMKKMKLIKKKIKISNEVSVFFSTKFNHSR